MNRYNQPCNIKYMTKIYTQNIYIILYLVWYVILLIIPREATEGHARPREATEGHGRPREAPWRPQRPVPAHRRWPWIWNRVIYQNRQEPESYVCLE